jgi:hypothetical protein
LSFASEVGSSAATVLSTAPGTVMSIERLL